MAKGRSSHTHTLKPKTASVCFGSLLFCEQCHRYHTFHVFTDYEKCITSGSIEMESLKTIPFTLSRLCTASNSFVVSSSLSLSPPSLSLSLPSLSALSSLFNYSPTLCVCVSLRLSLYDIMNYTHLNQLHLKSLSLARGPTKLVSSIF